jgi:uncharacterized protein (TIGR03435 family)
VVVGSPGAAALPQPPAPIDPSAPLPSFDVASVKHLPKPPTSTTQRSGPGRLMYSNVPLRSLIMLAWGIRDNQIIGGPGWLTIDRFSVNARAETGVPRDQVLLMLRSLIVERFQLKYRAEKRELPTYVLTLPGKEWKPTEHMKPCSPRPIVLPANASPELLAAAAAAGVQVQIAPAQAGTSPQTTSKPQTSPSSSPTVPPTSTATPQANPPSPPTATPQPTPPAQVAAGARTAAASPGICGSVLSSGSSGFTLSGTMATLVSALGSFGGLGLVQDRTGLTGNYEFELDASILESRLLSSQPTSGDSLLPNVSVGPSISSSVKDLGLKLERRKEPVDVLVIESVSHPDED